MSADPIEALRSAGFAIATDQLTRALFSSDASLHRVVPRAVATPKSVAELAALAEAARAERLPITTRGAGTSIAGNAIGPGLIIDCRRLDTISQLDPRGATAWVEPGVIAGQLTAAAAPYGLRLGPDPSTVDRCTIAGMIGNNACGARALGYGRTADNLLALTAITGTGERLHLTSPPAPEADRDRGSSATLDALQQLVQRNLGVIRTEFGRFSRQVSGYSLEHLLPERGFDVARFLAGSEGTLAVVTGARLTLVSEPHHTVMIAVGYPDMPRAADAVAGVLFGAPTAIEGLDRRIIDVVIRRRGAAAVPRLPQGDGWLLIELAGDVPAELHARAQAVMAAAGGLESRLIVDPSEAARLWRIRADGAGLAGVGLERPAHSGWEDSAVPPAALGAYLRRLDELLAAHQLHGLPYGHFGEGCVHLRIDFPLEQPDGPARYRSFLEDAADLVASYGGTLSGEHGDGRARSQLLSRMYSPAAMAVFAEVKRIFDPQNLLNPGVLVDPRPLDADLRAAAPRSPVVPADFAAAVHRCTGVASCLAPGGTMCPSYRATRRDADSTRGRARVLQELANGSLITQWRSSAVDEALDLCLSCKACRSECPTGTDIAAAKSITLDHAYRGRLRPRSHYTLGRLSGWTTVVTAIPGLPHLLNAVLRVGALRRLAAFVAGIDPRRALPPLSARPARRLADQVGTLPVWDDGELAAGSRQQHEPKDPGEETIVAPPRISAKPRGGPLPSSLSASQAALSLTSSDQSAVVAIWVDPFTDSWDPARVAPLVTLLRQAGFAPSLIRRRVDSGVALITTGQRSRASASLRRALDVLHPIAAAGVPIVGMDPSALAVWRSDASELIDDPRLDLVRERVVTVAELLTASGWRPPDLSGTTVVAQPHCHQASVLGWDSDAALLERSGARVITVEGCCGMAGNFGMESGHYDVSVAVAEQGLLPAIEAAGADAVILADGFSCRFQVRDLTGRHAVTLAELFTGQGHSGGKAERH